MRDLINHDIDIHGFMGSTIAGIFKDLPEFDIKNEKLVIEYKTRIKTFKESQPTRYKELRQLSKAADFGYPGGLGAARFVTYAKGYGVTLTEKESAELRDLWLKTFPEMNKHFQAERMVEPGNENWFKAITLTGRVRARCGFCAALNTALT